MQKGFYEIDVKISPADDFFELHLGQQANNLTEMIDTGISFSGQNGYIFDQDGLFFGGYTPNDNFKIKVVKKNYYDFSYYFNDTLIANDMQINTTGVGDISALNSVYFSAGLGSTLNGESVVEKFGSVEAGTFGSFLEDNLDNYLYSQDNILLVSQL